MIIEKIINFVTSNNKEVEFITLQKSKAFFTTQLHKTIVLPISITPSGVWILNGGFWDDGGIWDDTAYWID